MGDDEKFYPWRDGLPTKPDVDALFKAFPIETIKPGEWRATDEEVKGHIGIASLTRFRTVYAVWIRRLGSDHSIIVYREKDTGFYCPTAAEVFSRTHPTLQSAGRMVGRQMRGVSRAKPTNENERSTQDHQGRLLYVQRRELKKARMNVIPGTAAKETPKISAPAKSGKS